MQVLKQSTTATILVGPVLDPDGAAYTGGVIGDFNATKNGSTAALAAAATATHSHNGMYLIALTTGNTDTLGRLDISLNKATYGMTNHRYEVLSANQFDALVTNGSVTPAAIADQVWDEAYADHNVAGSFGKLLNTIRKANLAIDGTVSTAITPTTLTFSSNVVATTSAYAHAVLLFVSGPLTGENSPIISYNNTNGVFVLEEPLTATPSDGDEFVVLAGSHVHAIADIQSGLATTSQLTTVEGKVDGVKAKTDNLPADPADASDIAASFATVNTKLDAIDDYVDTEVAAIKAKTDNLPSDPADASDITAAFTQIKGAGWTTNDTLEAIRDAVDSSGGGSSIIVTPVVAQTPVRTVATNISTFKGDRSSITVGVFDELDPVDLSALPALEVCIQTKAGTDLQVIAAGSITISGTDSNYFSFSPGSAAVATVGRFMWSLRVAASNSKQVIAYGAWIVEDAALSDA